MNDLKESILKAEISAERISQAKEIQRQKRQKGNIEMMQSDELISILKEISLSLKSINVNLNKIDRNISNVAKSIR